MYILLGVSGLDMGLTLLGVLLFFPSSVISVINTFVFAGSVSA